MSASGSLDQTRPLGDLPASQVPPRTLAGLSYTRLLFGGGFSQFAWIWLIFGSLFGWVFLQNIDTRAIFFNAGEIASAPATIVEAWYTGSSSNDEDIYAYRYTFYTPGEEQRYAGVSYSTVSFGPGQAVAVDYRADDPANSRIRGMRQAPFGPWNLVWAAGMPLIGLGLVGWALRRTLRSVRLVTGGLIARTSLVSSTRTGASVNDRPVYKLVFRYACQRGAEHTAVWRTTDPEIVRDQQACCVLYNPDRPADALIIGSLPAKPWVDDLGRVELGSPVANVAVLTFPLLAMLISGFLLASLVR